MLLMSFSKYLICLVFYVRKDSMPNIACILNMATLILLARLINRQVEVFCGFVRRNP